MNAIPFQTAMRLMAIVLTAALLLVCEENSWRAIVTSLGLGHYLLSIIYARSQIKRLVSDRSYALPLFGATVAGAGAYLMKFPLIILFGLHHVFNEVYSVNSVPKETNGLTRRHLQIFAITVNFFLYFAILRNEPVVRRLDPTLLLAACAASCLFFFRALYKLRRTMTGSQLIESCSFEVMAIVILGLSYWIPVPFLALVCYHFVLWCFLPLPKLQQRGSTAVRDYVFMTVACTSLFLFLSPIGFRSYSIAHSIFLNQFYLWSYIHIFSSFALSRSHPEWIVKWFWPASAISARPRSESSVSGISLGQSV